MLSRTANNLYWMARYVERAENMARILDASYRMSLQPRSPEDVLSNWGSAITIAGDPHAFLRRYGEANAKTAMTYMALDQDNPSSIYSCIRSARENARAVRVAVTTEMWESINATWLEMRETNAGDLTGAGVRRFLDWVRECSHLFRGVAYGTMLRDEAFHFVRLGTFLERADNTARILDVKYHILLPDEEQVGGSADYYQWGALLQSVSALTAYKRLYRTTILPWNVAEMLILRADMPRSLHACMAEIDESLGELRTLYAQTHESHRLAGEILASLRFARMDEVFRQGLHEFLVDFIIRNNRLGAEISQNYLLVT